MRHTFRVIFQRLLAIILFPLAGCIQSPTPKLTPRPPKEPTPIEWQKVVPERIAQADGISVGTIHKLEADWTYDDPCGLVAVIMKRCDGTVTYRMRIDPEGTWLWTFTPGYGEFGLFDGEQGVFIWRKVWAFRYKQCKEQQGMTSATCPGDELPALIDDLDVLPIADSAAVREIQDTLSRKSRNK